MASSSLKFDKDPWGSKRSHKGWSNCKEFIHPSSRLEMSSSEMYFNIPRLPIEFSRSRNEKKKGVHSFVTFICVQESSVSTLTKFGIQFVLFRVSIVHHQVSIRVYKRRNGVSFFSKYTNIITIICNVCLFLFSLTQKQAAEVFDAVMTGQKRRKKFKKGTKFPKFPYVWFHLCACGFARIIKEDWNKMKFVPSSLFSSYGSVSLPEI